MSMSYQKIESLPTTLRSKMETSTNGKQVFFLYVCSSEFSWCNCDLTVVAVTSTTAFIPRVTLPEILLQVTVTNQGFPQAQRYMISWQS